MNIMICHERLLFRFGADRVLLLLARELRNLGHHVTLAANRYDPEVAISFSDRVVDVPGDLGPYLDLNELTELWLRDFWDTAFAEKKPDIVVVGGWPFIAAIPFFREVCPRVIFIDFGVVPADGYSEGMAITLGKLRDLRRKFLPESSMVVGISDFIVNTQSRLDAGPGIPVRSILLGADHVGMSVWPRSCVGGTASGHSLNLVKMLKARGNKILLCLGRWEAGCYKNSEASFIVLERILAAWPNCRLLILDKAGAVEIPNHLTDYVVPIGFPDDEELAGIMSESDLGISMSRWEGFNLPLAEMQWLGRPALVFDAGAHAEVAAHPWYICCDVDEMASKAQSVFGGEGLDEGTALNAFDRFRAGFTWARFTREYDLLFREREHGDSPAASPGLTVLVDVSNSARDPANSGVIRVTRRLSRELQRRVTTVFAVWEPRNKRYVFPTRDEYDQLSQFNGPVFTSQSCLSSSESERAPVDDLLPGGPDGENWILISETVMEAEFANVRSYARARGFRIAAIFYDAIPVLHPELCNAQVRDNHAEYMTGLAECDLAIPISNFSADCLRSFWRQNSVSGSCAVVANLLPGEFAGAGRTRNADGGRSGNQVRILCVSTLEPRKNHRGLIAACLDMATRHPELDWVLTLIGNRYAGAFEIAEFVEQVSARDPRIRWLGIVDDSTLHEHYQKSLFTVYASTIEGFGLPIMESLWHGRPCICHREGVMAELAEGGGCLTADVSSSSDLAESIWRLSTDAELHRRLTLESVTRPIKTWDDYARGTAKLVGDCVFSKHSTASDPKWRAFPDENYPADDLQMNRSERMALAGLLARQKPHCSIEVGTCASSLSLIAEFSDIVFSLGSVQAIPTWFARFQNASFLSGRSTDLLPLLLAELDSVGIAVDFVLLNGTHSAEAMREDIACLLRYIPRRAMLVLLHNSFDPEFRREMQLAGWENSSYCQWIDLDFVPGRLNEHDDGKHDKPCGGLAAAYFHPSSRGGSVKVTGSCERMFQVLRDKSRPGLTN